MSFTTLVTAAELRTLAGPRVLLDCSFDLTDPEAGERQWRAGHLPGALYASLDRDLSGARTGRNGRHPLPARADFATMVGRWGIAPGVQVVTYDAQGGFYAARAWWMLQWLGHEAAAVLDGGVAAWQAAGGTLVADAPAVTPRPPYPMAEPAPMAVVDAATLGASLGRVRVVDARNAERFRGEGETLDPVGGHIPGATNRFFKDNLQPDGRFKPAALLRAEFETWATPAGDVVHQCGSGVTACHNLLAMAHAGLPGSRLYAGSWSEWSADPARPVARG